MKNDKRGTFVSFKTTRNGDYLLTFIRESGQEITCLLAPETAQQLADRYGVRDVRGADRKSMKSLKNLRFTYQETKNGLLVGIEMMHN